MADISKQAIEERLVALATARDHMLAQLNAQNGAIEDCKYWLGVLAAPEPEEEAQP